MPVTGTGWSSVASHRQQPHVMLANDGEPALTGGNELTVAPALFEKLSNRYIQPASPSQYSGRFTITSSGDACASSLVRAIHHIHH